MPGCGLERHSGHVWRRGSVWRSEGEVPWAELGPSKPDVVAASRGRVRQGAGRESSTPDGPDTGRGGQERRRGGCDAGRCQPQLAGLL